MLTSEALVDAAGSQALVDAGPLVDADSDALVLADLKHPAERLRCLCC